MAPKPDNQDHLHGLLSLPDQEVQEDFFRQLLEAIPHPLCVIDANDYTVILANPAALGPNGRLGTSCHALLYGNAQPCERLSGHLCPLAQVKTEGKPVVVEHIQCDADGERHYEVHAFPIFDSQGQVARVIEYSRDISDRRRQEAETKKLLKTIEQAKWEWELTMDCVGDLIFLVDEKGVIRRCNRTVSDYLQLDFKEILGRDLAGLCADHGLTLPAEPDGQEVHQAESDRWFSVKQYHTGCRGEKTALSRLHRVVTFHEITMIREIGAELARKNREIDSHRLALQNAVNSHSELIKEVTQREDFSVRFQNPELVCCYERQECAMEACPCHGQSVRRCWAEVGTLCRGQRQGAFASKIDSCTKCEVYRAATGDTNLLLGEQFNVMMDMLENKNLELQEAYEQMKRTQSQFLQQEKMASIGQLAAGVAHEINNPMGFISSNLGTLDKYLGRLEEFIKVQTEALGDSSNLARTLEVRNKLKIDYVLDDTRDLIAESREGAERVRRIVQNLKSFSRVDQTSEEQDADLNECLETTLNIVWNELKYKATVHKDYGELPRIKCMPQQLNQVFMNLLVNAAQAIDNQGEITIRTWTGNGLIQVAISDTGCGIPPGQQEKIFEPFFTTKPVGKGTGLGLSICYDIVKKHGGDILVASTEGEGSTFTVVLSTQKGEILSAD